MFIAYFRETKWTRKKDRVRSRCALKFQARKKGLHLCKPLISLDILVGPAGVEPTTNGLKE